MEMRLAVHNSCGGIGRVTSDAGREADPAAFQRGLTMIEILVTLVIVSVGLLGAAAMVINGLESNRNAFLQTQASVLAYDMADRIRSNAEQVDGYVDFDFYSLSESAPDLPTCFTSNASCSAADQVKLDLAQWASALEGADADMPLLPAAEGRIFRNGTRITIRVGWVETHWDEDAGTVADQIQYFDLIFNL